MEKISQNSIAKWTEDRYQENGNPLTTSVLLTNALCFVYKRKIHLEAGLTFDSMLHQFGLT